MKARPTNLKRLALVAAISLTFLSWGVMSSAEFHHVADCTVCHDMHGGSSNIKLIKEVITTPYSEDKDVVFTVSGEGGDYAGWKEDTPFDGVCEVCHTSLVKFYRNDGLGTDHPTFTVNEYEGGEPGTDCSQCHSHCNEFSHCSTPGTGCHDSAAHVTHTGGMGKGPSALVCDDCHLMSDESKSFEIATIVADGKCDSCHSPGGAFNGINDATVGVVANWGAEGEGIYEEDGVTLKAGKEKWCATCHDDDPASSAGPSGAQVIVDDPDADFSPDCAPGSCDPYIEWQYWDGGTHYGPTGLRYMAIKSQTIGGTVDGTVTWTPTIAEAGEYQVYAWWDSTGGGVYRSPSVTYTIHYNDGTDSVQVPADQTANGGQWVYLDTLNFDAGTSCYVELTNDAAAGTGSVTWVTADAILFTTGSAGSTDAPIVVGDNTNYGFYATGHGANGVFHCLNCHDAGKKHIDHNHRTYTSSTGSSGYQTGYRLRSIGDKKPMTMPKPVGNPQAYWQDFILCFDCHNRNEVLGVDITDVSHTNFVHNETNSNSHYFHLIKNRPTGFDCDFDGTGDSAFTCTACHNVHGSSTPAMIRDGKLIKVNRNFPPDYDALGFSYLPPGSDLENSTGHIMDHDGKKIAQNGICVTCHATGTSIRTPFLGPKVIAPQAEPEEVTQGQETDVLLTVFVHDHSDPYDVSTVTVDLSPILGAGFVAVLMYDDGDNVIDGSGTDSGDKVPGDRIYSHLRTVPDTVDSGQYNLVVTAEDLTTLTGENTIELSVAGLYDPMIIDDPDATFVPDCISCNPYSQWARWDGGDHYGPTGLRYMAIKSQTTGGTIDGTATWAPTIDETGEYQVYAWWDSSSGDLHRSPSVTYTIHYNDGTDTVPVTVDQTEDGGRWVYLDSLNFNAGTSCYVELTNDAAAGTGYVTWVIADAIKFRPIGAKYTVSGQITRDATGLNGVTVTLGGDMINSTVTAGNGNYSFTLPDGNYTITPSLFGYDFVPASQNVEVSGGPETADFVANWTGILDDPDAIFSPDCLGGSCDPYTQWAIWDGGDHYGPTGLRYMAIKSQTTGGTINGTATWTPSIPSTGQYNVYAWWDSTGGSVYRSPGVTYTIYYNDGTDSVQVPADHTADGGQWNLLDTLNFNAGTSCYVELTNDASAGTGSVTWVIADAIWWEPVPVP